MPPLKGDFVGGERLAAFPVEGRPSLIYFWGSWCPICRRMEGTLRDISTRYPVVSVALKSGDVDTVRSMLEAKSLSFRTLVDPQGEIAETFGVQGVPALFFLDGSGRLRSVTVGYTTEIGIRLRLGWAALFEGQAAPSAQ